MISQRQSSILSRFLPVYPSARSAERKLSGSLRIRISELLSLRFFDEHGSSSEQIDPDQSKHITAVTLCTEYESQGATNDALLSSFGEITGGQLVALQLPCKVAPSELKLGNQPDGAVWTADQCS